VLVPPQLFVTVGKPVLDGNVLAVQEISTSLQVITGAWLSSRKIVCKQVLELLQSSFAVHVRLIVYSCGQFPAVVTSAKVIVTLASHASTPVAVPVAAGLVLLPQFTVMLAGQVMTGGTKSLTVMV